MQNKKPNKRPNIIFILQDHQAYYGHGMYEGGVTPKRPHFEAFAEEGIEFTCARSVTPMCGPARRSFLTGLYPHTHAQVHNENDPPYDHDVFLEALGQAGYANYYYGKWHAGPGDAKDFGCEGHSTTSYGNPYITDDYRQYIEERGLEPATHLIEHAFMADSYIEQGYFNGLEKGNLYRCETDWCGEHASGITVTSKESHEAFFLANLACDQLEAIARDPDPEQPFCLNVHFWGPHQPFFPTQEYADLYTAEEIGVYPSFNDRLEGQPDVFRMEASRPLTSDGTWIDIPSALPWSEWQQILARCYGHISMIDAAGGRIVDKVKELGLDENTLIVWTTDHGDALASHGGHFDKDSHMSEEVMRVPLALRWPQEIEGHQRDDSLVFTCDVTATIVDAAGVELSNRIDGRSLLPRARKEGGGWRTSLMCESYGHGYGTTIISRMVVDNRYKYVAIENDLEQLYDLKEDPFEMHNLAAVSSYASLKEHMRDLIREHQEESKDPIRLDDLLATVRA